MQHDFNRLVVGCGHNIAVHDFIKKKKKTTSTCFACMQVSEGQCETMFT